MEIDEKDWEAEIEEGEEEDKHWAATGRAAARDRVSPRPHAPPARPCCPGTEANLSGLLGRRPVPGDVGRGGGGERRLGRSPASFSLA